MEAKKLFFGEEGVADVLADMGLTEAEVPSPLSVLRTLSVLFVCAEKGPFLPLSVSVVRVSLCSCLHGGLYGAPYGRDLYTNYLPLLLPPAPAFSVGTTPPRSCLHAECLQYEELDARLCEQGPFLFVTFSVRWPPCALV